MEHIKENEEKSTALTQYRESWCKDLILHMASGHSFESFAAVINVTADELNSYLSNKNFKRARDIGYVKEYLLFEKVGIDGMMGKIRGFNGKVWADFMKNKYDWKSGGAAKVQVVADKIAEINEMNYDSIWEKARKRQLKIVGGMPSV